MPNSTTVQISASILAADMAELAAELAAVEEADRFHLDVMDGHFVPNLSMGPWLVECLRKRTAKPFDVHLMLANPKKHVQSFLSAGADLIFIHEEAEDAEEALARVPQDKAGLAINPETPLPANPRVSSILIMTVNPGFCGQSFLHDQVSKIAQARRAGLSVHVDGGINATTGPIAIGAGANVLVAGSAIYGGGQRNQYSQRIRAIKGK